MRAAILVMISSSALGGGLLLGDRESGGGLEQRTEPARADQPVGAPAQHAADSVDSKKLMNAAELQAISARLAKVSEQLAALEVRVRQSFRRVPTAEEFRQQVADGRREIERRRAEVAARWNEVKHVAEARRVKLDGVALRDSIPEGLKSDAEFLAARDRALHEARLVDVLEERLIKVMLTTTIDNAGPPRGAIPPESAIERERQNLAAAQKAMGTAAQNARRKAAAAKVQFDPSALFKEQPIETGAAIDRGVLDAMERARAQMRARDASAESLAELEFSQAVGPLRVNW